jgi:hypothetical protein
MATLAQDAPRRDSTRSIASFRSLKGMWLIDIAISVARARGLIPREGGQ